MPYEDSYHHAFYLLSAKAFLRRYWDADIEHAAGELSHADKNPAEGTHNRNYRHWLTIMYESIVDTVAIQRNSLTGAHTSESGPEAQMTTWVLLQRTRPPPCGFRSRLKKASSIRNSERHRGSEVNSCNLLPVA